MLNILAEIRKYWWEKFSKIIKRTGTTIPDSRVDIILHPLLYLKGYIIADLDVCTIGMCQDWKSFWLMSDCLAPVRIW